MAKFVIKFPGGQRQGIDADNQTHANTKLATLQWYHPGFYDNCTVEPISTEPEVYWLLGIDPVKLLAWATKVYPQPFVEKAWFTDRWEMIRAKNEDEARQLYAKRIVSYEAYEKRFIEVFGYGSHEEVYKIKNAKMQEVYDGQKR